MSWKSSGNLVRKRLNQHGLGGLVYAGIVCEKAESLYPDLFKAVSVKNNCLHVEVIKKNQLKFKLIQGKLIEELNVYAKAQNLPEISKVRLTFASSSDILGVVQ